LWILSGDGETEAELPGLTQNRGEGFGGELVELVHVEVEVAPVLLGNIRPAHGSQLDAGHEEGGANARRRTWPSKR
jgi:hypothetical protein